MGTGRTRRGNMTLQITGVPSDPALLDLPWPARLGDYLDQHPRHDLVDHLATPPSPIPTNKQRYTYRTAKRGIFGINLIH